VNPGYVGALASVRAAVERLPEPERFLCTVPDGCEEVPAVLLGFDQYARFLRVADGLYADVVRIYSVKECLARQYMVGRVKDELAVGDVLGDVLVLSEQGVVQREVDREYSRVVSGSFDGLVSMLFDAEAFRGAFLGSGTESPWLTALAFASV